MSNYTSQFSLYFDMCSRFNSYYFNNTDSIMSSRCAKIKSTHFVVYDRNTRITDVYY